MDGGRFIMRRITTGNRSGDLLEVTKMLRLDLAECNKSKARLREWVHQETAAMGREE